MLGTHVNIVNDNSRLRIGTGQDLQFYHNGTDTVISNDTGDLYFLNNGTNSDDIFIKAKDDIELFVDTNELGIVARGGAQTELYFDASKKLETRSTGIYVSGLTETGTFLATSTSEFRNNVKFDGGFPVTINLQYIL